MSRTYRKNYRWYKKYNNEFFNTYDDRSLQGKHRSLPVVLWHYCDYNFWHGGSRQYFDVVVGDRDNVGSNGFHSSQKWYKRIAHGRDRARCRQAIYHHPDSVHFKPGFDRWEID